MSEAAGLALTFFAEKNQNKQSKKTTKGGGGERAGERKKPIPDNETAEQLVIWKLVSHRAAVSAMG